jgi:hypothetical protein
MLLFVVFSNMVIPDDVSSVIENWKARCKEQKSRNFCFVVLYFSYFTSKSFFLQTQYSQSSVFIPVHFILDDVDKNYTKPTLENSKFVIEMFANEGEVIWLNLI